MRASPRHPTLGRWLLRLGAIAAVVAQLALNATPLAEAFRGQDAAAHVEPAGTATHYAHNEATCANCQARSLHGLAADSPASLLPTDAGGAVMATVPGERLAAELFSPNNPRGPPSSSSI